jgi:hypothetical protein
MKIHNVCTLHMFSLCWPLIPLRHISNEKGAFLAHVSSITVGSLLPLFPASGGAGSGLACISLPSHTLFKLVPEISGSGQFPINLSENTPLAWIQGSRNTNSSRIWVGCLPVPSSLLICFLAHFECDVS